VEDGFKAVSHLIRYAQFLRNKRRFQALTSKGIGLLEVKA
jgi:hypothetical protein